MVTLDELLTEDHGDDQEIKVVILSFLLGQTIRKSKIDMQQAVAMCVSASKVAA